MSDLFNDNLPQQIRPLKMLPPNYIKTDWTPPSEFPSLDGHKRISIDVETKDPYLDSLGPGVYRKDGYIVGISVGIDNHDRLYFPIRHEGGGNLDVNSVLNWARYEFGRYKGEVVGARLIYDLDWLGSENISFHKKARFLDIQNAEPLIDENRLGYSLEILAQYYLGETKDTLELIQVKEAYKFKTDKALKQNLWRLPANLVGSYAEGDVDLPLRILPLQLKILEEQDLMRVWDVETRLIPMLLAMRQRGVRVNADAAIRLRSKLIDRRQTVLAKLRRISGREVVLTLPETLAPVLEKAGIKVPKTPKTDKPSITKPFLQKHASIPECSLIIEGRKYNTIINTFIDGHILGHSVDGRIHCEFNQLKRDEAGTIARFSSSNPNLQNVPARDDELAPMIRGMFEPEDGETWEKQDLSQIEYRFLVHYARGQGADEARARFNQDPTLSFHNMCGEMFGLEQMEGEVYKRIKNTNFCKVYGGGVEKLAETFGCSFAEAKSFNTTYEKNLPFVMYTFDEADKLGARRGYIRTILRRRRRFPLWEPKKWSRNTDTIAMPYEQAKDIYGLPLRRSGTRNALSGMLQGGAADYMKKSMVDMWDAGICTVLGAPLLTVHDELDWSIPLTQEGEQASAEAKHIFETSIKLRVPVLADAERGQNWGKCK